MRPIRVLIVDDAVVIRRMLTDVLAARENLRSVEQSVLVSVVQAYVDVRRDQERLRFAYRRADGTESERTVEPHRLVALQPEALVVSVIGAPGQGEARIEAQHQGLAVEVGGMLRISAGERHRGNRLLRPRHREPARTADATLVARSR